MRKRPRSARGVGEAGRQTVRALTQTGYRVDAHDVALGVVADFIAKVEVEIERQLATLPRADIARQALSASLRRLAEQIVIGHQQRIAAERLFGQDARRLRVDGHGQLRLRLRAIHEGLSFGDSRVGRAGVPL